MPSTQEQPSASSPARSSTSKDRRRRRPFKWTRRFAFFCGWLVLMCVCLVSLLVGLAWVAIQNAAPIANIACEQLAPDYPIEIGSISYLENGVVEIGNIELEHPEDRNRNSASIKRIRLKFPQGKKIPSRFESILIENADVTLDDALLSMFAPKNPKDPAAPADLSWVKIDDLELVNGKVNLDLNGVPKGSWKIDRLQAQDIDFARRGDRFSPRPQRVILRDIYVGDPHDESAPPLASADELAIDFSLHKDFVSGAIASLRVTNPIVRHSPRLIAALEGEPAAPSVQDPVSQNDKAPSAPMRWTIDEVYLDGGFFSMTDFYDTPDVSFRHSGTFTDLEWRSDTGLTWATPQKATLHDFRLDAPALPRPVGEVEDADAPVLAQIRRIDLAGTPDDFFTEGWIDQIIAIGTEIHVTEANTRRFFTAAPEGADTDSEPTEDEEAEEEPWIIRVRDLDVTDAKLAFEADSFKKGLPNASARINIRSSEEQPDPQDDVAYGLAVSEIDIREPGQTEKAFVTGDEIYSSFTSNGIQRDQRIESLRLSGIKVRVGEEIERLIEELGKEETPTVSEEIPETPESSGIAFEPDPIPVIDPLPLQPQSLKPTEPEWTIGRIELEETRFTLEDFIPGLPYVPLVLETTLEEVPLGGRDSGDERPQRIELRNLEVASPYNSLLPVAKLKSIWIHFTIPGLVRNEIEMIEIVSPEIYLGEHLFWYVDYYRDLASNTLDPDAEKEKIAAAAAHFTDPCAPESDAPDAEAEEPKEGKIGAVEDALKNTEVSGWKINNVVASTGKLIVAPKGYPIGILPFPFAAKTNLAEGKIELDLKVPSGDYVFEQLKLELRGLNGEAFFNYPIRKENNNFVQTFRVPDLRYEDYRADDVYLSVTYDENGIYGKLGGNAYGGYAEGEFNIYIAETYKWDAWVAGTKLQLGPLTDVLAPETVKVTGTVDANIVANGEGLVPEKVTGDLQTSGLCHMHVTKLDDVLASLPEPDLPAPDGWVDILDAVFEPLTAGMQHALSEAGIEAFRHYDFTAGNAKLELVGRDGTASMILDGPDGKRDVVFRLFDKRELPDTAKKPQ